MPYKSPPPPVLSTPTIDSKPCNLVIVQWCTEIGDRSMLKTRYVLLLVPCSLANGPCKETMCKQLLPLSWMPQPPRHEKRKKKSAQINRTTSDSVSEAAIKKKKVTCVCPHQKQHLRSCTLDHLFVLRCISAATPASIRPLIALWPNHPSRIMLLRHPLYMFVTFLFFLS